MPRALVADLRRGRSDVEGVLAHHLETPCGSGLTMSAGCSRRVRAAIHLGAGRFLDLADGQSPPDTDLAQTLHELGHAEAEHHDDLARVWSAWRMATKGAWQEISNLCRSTAADAEALAALTELLFEMMDTLFLHVEHGFLRAKHPHQSEAILGRALAHPSHTQHLERLFAERDMPPPEAVMVAVIEHGPETVPSGHRPLTVRLVSWADSWHTTVVADETGYDPVREWLVHVSHAALVAVIGPVGLDGVGPARGWALHMLRLRHEGRLPPDPFVDGREHADTILFDTDPLLRHHLVRTALGPLTELSDHQRWVLGETLLAWLVTRSAPAAASALGVHANTVRHRLARLDALFGSRLREPDSQRRMIVALSAILPEWRAADPSRHS